MSKQTRKERKEEEKRVLAEMDEAMKSEGKESEETKKEQTEGTKGKFLDMFKDKTPEKMHCHRCKTLMENGVCPTCGFRAYVPMDKEKQKKIRLILGGVCFAAFIILFLWLQMR